MGNGGINKVGEATYLDPYIYAANYSPVYVWENLFTKANAEFAYWKDADTGLPVEGESFTMPGHDVTLVAQWKMVNVSKSFELPKDAEGNQKTAFALNDRIDFTINVTNAGDTELTDVVVTDDLPGVVIDSGYGYSAEGSVARISSMAAGGTVSVKAHYIVTEEEVGKNNFTNTATATAGTVTGTDTTDPIPMDDVDKQISISNFPHRMVC